jgi:hypothetical protein
MANTRFKTTLEVDVEVVGHYTGETPARGMMGPPEDSEPGEPEDFEIEAVLVTVPRGVGGHDLTQKINILDALSEGVLEDIRACGCEQAQQAMEDAYVDAMAARAEARRDREEDR